MRVILTLLIFMMCVVMSNARSATDWYEGYGYKVRLIQGEQNDDGTINAALEVALDDGWKTYWRVPGENGIPPRFDFSLSQNLEDVVISWPAPIIFKDGYGYSVGYEGDLTLPIQVKPYFKDEAVNLHMSAFFGVCEEICVPAQEQIEISLDPSNASSALQENIDAALGRVPAESPDGGAEIHNAKLHQGSEVEYIEVDLTLPETASNLGQIYVLLEGRQDWFFDPKLVKRSVKGDNIFAAKVPLYRQDSEPIKPAETIRVTVITPGHAIEKIVALSE